MGELTSVDEEVPNKIALVTGATSGIGEATARRLLEVGWRVFGMSRRPSVIEHDRYAHVVLDLAGLDEMPGRVETDLAPVVSAPGIRRLCLVNCAADPGILGTVDSIDAMAVHRVYAVNVVAPMWLMGWLARSGGDRVPTRIVNVSSGAAVAPYPGLGTYGGTKAALRMVAMVFASELDLADDSRATNRDITVLSYSPGAVDTPMQAAARESPRSTLPIVDLFAGWKDEGSLLPPGAPAREIQAYADGDGHPRFAEWRFGE